ncbi:MAG: 4Fe-4S dicluster domain-containing protein [Anaerolineae bacterium]|nr:4Fe-4S dicluster domain-containing protein [Anaerolineae bacterium]
MLTQPNQPISLLAATVVGLLMLLSTIWAASVSFAEHERRAAIRILFAGTLLTLPYIAVTLLDDPFRKPIAIILIILPSLAAAALLFPFGPKTIPEDDTPKKRIDERDIMFARYRLQPGSERFETYYAQHPDKKGLDDKFRARPGLLAKGSAYYDPFLFSAAEASFATVGTFHAILDRASVAEQTRPDPESMTRFIKWWGKKLGTMSVGVTELQDYHLYSYLGRNEPYGQLVELDHRFAIALTVEMDKAMLDHAPYSPTVMESSQQYLNAGAIAVQIAEFAHHLGYPARAHIDGNYRVVCPLVARDAGLGEIGRMGLLITPELGPRVRLAVVTTDLPLVVDERSRDHSVTDFCTHCKKCATICPSEAIPFGNRTEIDGVKRWQINSEACFTFWCQIGTDCGRCVRVCPYSHPNTLLHNIIRFGVRTSPLFRAVAIKMDDLIYGRRPSPKPVPAWTRFKVRDAKHRNSRNPQNRPEMTQEQG